MEGEHKAADKGYLSEKEIEWAAHVHITTGYDDGTFGPTSPIARDAVAAFLWRYADQL